MLLHFHLRFVCWPVQSEFLTVYIYYTLLQTNTFLGEVRFNKAEVPPPPRFPYFSGTDIFHFLNSQDLCKYSHIFTYKYNSFGKYSTAREFSEQNIW